MMDQQDHPITPPPELVEDWAQKAQLLAGDDPVAFAELLCNKAARWGADQELEACIDFVRRGPWCSKKLRATRRPKPPSLKEQALEAAARFYAKGHEDCTDEEVKDDFDTIRRALEQLDD